MSFSSQGVIDQDAMDGARPVTRARAQMIGETDIAIEAATENEEVKKSIFKAWCRT